MSKYIAIYKCQLCGQKIRISSDELSLDSKEEALEAIQKVKTFQKYLPSGSPPSEVIHPCSNGDYGIATFAGLYKVR